MAAPAIGWAVWGRRPQLTAEVVAATAWLLVVAHPLAMAVGVHAHAHESMAGWLTMAAAMMLPGAWPAARHVGVNSLRWRRHRAVGEYVAGYLAVWAGVGVVVLRLTEWRRPPLAAALAVAALWQATRSQASFVRDCHRTVPLPPTGWRATAGAVRFGLRNGRACAGMCWALMLTMAVVPAADAVVWNAVLAAAVASQKLLPRPRWTSRVVGIGLAAAALTAVVSATLAVVPVAVSVGVAYETRARGRLRVRASRGRPGPRSIRPSRPPGTAPRTSAGR